MSVDEMIFELEYERLGPGRGTVVLSKEVAKEIAVALSNKLTIEDLQLAMVNTNAMTAGLHQILVRMREYLIKEGKV